ncbi:endonuclease VII [Mycobacterium phage Hannaconda]|nr:endonuclease VII [Mycobacterium phage Hannaconda]
MRSCNRKWCQRPQWRASVCKRHWFEYAASRCVGGTKADLKLILLEEQEHRCANPGCRAPLAAGRGAHLDHDHDCCGSGKACVACTRGILCPACNLMLGSAKDDIERLRGAIEYLETFRLYGKPIAIVNRGKRGNRRFRTPRERQAIKDALRPEGQLPSEWEYRPAP